MVGPTASLVLMCLTSTLQLYLMWTSNNWYILQNDINNLIIAFWELITSATVSKKVPHRRIKSRNLSNLYLMFAWNLSELCAIEVIREKKITYGDSCFFFFVVVVFFFWKTRSFSQQTKVVLPTPKSKSDIKTLLTFRSNNFDIGWNNLSTVVQRADNSIQCINRYAADKMYSKQYILSAG